jgi:hypothetical protein
LGIQGNLVDKNVIAVDPRGEPAISPGYRLGKSPDRDSSHFGAMQDMHGSHAERENLFRVWAAISARRAGNRKIKNN